MVIAMLIGIVIGVAMIVPMVSSDGPGQTLSFVEGEGADAAAVVASVPEACGAELATWPDPTTLSVVGAEAELVAPIPAGPALAFAGSYSYLPMLGGVMMQLKGGDAPEDPPDLQYADGGIRLYVNNKARGLYVMGAAHWMEAAGGELTRDRELGPTLTRVGGSIRLGIHNEHKWTYTRVEMGLGSYGMVDLSDFDDEETGSFPLVQANLGFSFGVAPF